MSTNAALITGQDQRTRRADREWSQWAVCVWLFVRLALLFLLLVSNREALMQVVERYVGLERIIEESVYQVSCRVGRLLYVIVLAGILVPLAFWRERNRRSTYARLIPPIIVFGLSAATMALTGRSWWLAGSLLASCVYALNAIPAATITRALHRSAPLRLIALIAIGSEVAFCRASATAISNLMRFRPMLSAVEPRWTWLLGPVVVSVLGGVLLGHERLIGFERYLHRDAGVSVISQDDFNWLHADVTGRKLYAAGHGLRRIRKYDLDRPQLAPVEADTDTAGAQSFGYDATRKELAVFDAERQRIVIINADSMRTVRTFPLRGISPGDVFLEAEPITNSLIIASEADLAEGTSFAVVDRDSGTITSSLALAAGNILVHPAKPYVYLSFFRNTSELVIYDVAQRSIIHRQPADPRADRMLFVPDQNQIWLASPLNSRAIRYDAETLAPRGYMPTHLGGRTIAFDSVHNLIVSASLITGELLVLSGNGGQPRTVYLGPWLRSISLDPASGSAYVSSKFGLFQVKYR